MLSPLPLFATTVGSDTVPSRQSTVTFLEADSDNEMNGFAAFEDGFTLETPTTTCTFDSFFPVSGTVDMNGGTLYLQKDLIFDEGTVLNDMGTIYGNGHKVVFPESVTTFTAYDSQAAAPSTLTLKDTKSLTNDVDSVDWSYDDQYVASGEATSDLLTVHSFDGSTLTYIDNINVAGDIYEVAAHPSGYYFAIARNTSTVYVYKLSGGVLSLVDSETLGSTGMAVDWSPTGNYLLVGYASEDVEICSFSSEILTQIDVHDWGDDNIKYRAVCWDQTENYMVVGTGSRVRILGFNGSTISSKVYQSVGAAALAVDWAKTGSWIAAGTNAGSNQLYVYEYDSTGNTLTQRKNIDVGGTVKSVHWNSDATKLLVGKLNDTSGTELRIYDFDQGTFALTLDKELEVTTNINAVRWSNDDSYVITGDDANKVKVYEYVPSFPSSYGDSALLDDVSFVLHNNISWKMSTTMMAECTIDGGGNKITFEDTGVLKVKAGAQLTFENAELQGLTSETLYCAADNGSITFRNCTIHLDNDFEFGTGSLTFDGDVRFTGTNKFIYSTDQQSTIGSNSTLMFDHDTTFSYDPSSANRDLLYMTDETSFLFLNGCTLHSTATGLRLTRGTVFLDNGVTFVGEGSEDSEAICFGDGVANNDLTVRLLSDVEVSVDGAFSYNNANPG